jgi:hypothetical protein
MYGRGLCLCVRTSSTGKTTTEKMNKKFETIDVVGVIIVSDKKLTMEKIPQNFRDKLYADIRTLDFMMRSIIKLWISPFLIVFGIEPKAPL